MRAIKTFALFMLQEGQHVIWEFYERPRLIILLHRQQFPPPEVTFVSAQLIFPENFFSRGNFINGQMWTFAATAGDSTSLACIFNSVTVRRGSPIKRDDIIATPANSQIVIDIVGKCSSDFCEIVFKFLAGDKCEGITNCWRPAPRHMNI